MKITEANKNFVFTTHINLTDDEKEYIVLREPDMSEVKNIKTAEGEEKVLTALEKIFPSCVVESSFTDENDNSASGIVIYNELKKSATLFTEILSTWLGSLPFQSRLKKSEK